MGKIHELPKSSSRLLTSSQIITSVYCIVKELLENSLDGVSKNVEIKLEDYGVEKIEVKDNGSGIEKSDLQFVAKPHFTSKITSYSDLERVSTYGFRGEALGAISAVANLTVTTKTAEEPIGYSVNFNHDGEVISTKVCPCAQGTTVTVQNLFKNIPVRRQYYRSEKNKKDELHKIEELLISYGCIKNDVRFALYHNKNLIWQKPALSNTKNALIHILGNSIVDHMKFVEYVDEQNQIKIEMYLPALEAPQTCGLSSLSRCITSVNKRPVRIKAVDKLVKEYYNMAIKNTSKARYPICYISFTLPLSEVDVNIEPNKTNVMFHKSEEILKQFSELLKTFYDTSSNDNNENEMLTKNQKVSDKENTASIDTENVSTDKKTNASDFLSSLTLKCDAKFEQSKLSFNTDSPVSVIKESSQKNPTNILSCRQVDKSNSSMSKKDIVELNGIKEPSKKKLKTTIQVSKDDINKHINSLKNFFTEDKTNKVTDMSTSPVISSVTVERFQPEKSHSVAQGRELNNHINSDRITTFAVSSSVCPENSLHMAGNRKRHFSDSSITSIKSNEDILKRPAFDKNIADEEAWSRGIHPVGGLFQPVKVLQPKPVSLSESVPAKSPGNIDNSNIEKCGSKSFSFERKLTAFDIFCRNERLEVAAQNPDYSNQQIAQVLTEKWSRLTAEEKAVYKNLLDKDYKKQLKKKERLGKIVSENLNKSKYNESTRKTHKKKTKNKIKCKDVAFTFKQLAEFCQSKALERSTSEDLNIINYLAPGIWVCSEKGKLSLLNTFRLQETVIYHRLLQTFHFDIEALDTPQTINARNVSEEGLKILMELCKKDNNSSDTLDDERFVANGFGIKLIKEIYEETAFELIGITNRIAFYGMSDLKELLLLIKCKGYVTKLSECRPGKVMLYLQSEANRMSRQNPACQRVQDVEDLLNHNVDMLKKHQECIHHKPFYTELWTIS